MSAFEKWRNKVVETNQPVVMYLEICMTQNAPERAYLENPWYYAYNDGGGGEGEWYSRYGSALSFDDNRQGKCAITRGQ